MTDKSVTWDPEFDSNGPTCDIPTTDDPLSDDNSDDDYPYVAERSPAATASEPNRDCKVSLVHQPLPGRELGCTVVGKLNPQPIQLSQQGIDNILCALYEVEWLPRRGAP